MRKISKSRKEDDEVISSTNGSVIHDEHADATDRQADPDEKEAESEITENVEENENVSTSSTKESPKKGKAKNKSNKKRKSEKNVAEEEYEVCFNIVCKQYFILSFLNDNLMTALYLRVNQYVQAGSF